MACGRASDGSPSTPTMAVASWRALVLALVTFFLLNYNTQFHSLHPSTTPSLLNNNHRQTSVISQLFIELPIEARRSNNTSSKKPHLGLRPIFTARLTTGTCLLQSETWNAVQWRHDKDGDIETNPGPPKKPYNLKYPCGICDNSVKSNQDGLQCDKCDFWFHRKCVNMRTRLYNSLSPDEQWSCCNCAITDIKCDLLPHPPSPHPNNVSPPKSNPDKDKKNFSKRTFSIACINIDSILPKLPLVNIFLSTYNFDILAICETKLNDSIPTSEINVPGYAFIRADHTRSSGGVGFLIKNSVSYKLQPNISFPPLQSLTITTKHLYHATSAITVLYRPPSSPASHLDRISNLFDNLTSNWDNVIILGDFNYDFNKLNDPSSLASKFINVFTPFDLTQHINSPTRITKSSSTILDLILTTKDATPSNTGVIPYSFSDHSVIFYQHKSEKRRPVNSTVNSQNFYRNFKNYNQDAFRTDLNLINWSPVTSELDTNTSWNLFKKTFLQLSNIHAPITPSGLKNTSKTSKPNWLTADLIALGKLRDLQHKCALKTKRVDTWDLYKSTRNMYNKSIQLAITAFHANNFNLASKCSKTTWKLLKSILPSSNSSSSKPPGLESLVVNSTTVTSPKDVANTLNDHFTSVGSKLPNTTPASSTDPLIFTNSFLHDKPIPGFSFSPISPDTTLNLLLNLDSKKNMGMDLIHPRLLRDSALIITEPLTHILNRSLTTAVFPDDFKLAKVTPIFKGGDSTIPSNYRPISVLPCISKLLEKIVHIQITSYLFLNNLMAPQQSGFRKHYSTISSIHNILEICHKAREDRNPASIISFDVAKAFDSVKHPILLSKLKLYGFHSNTLAWIQDYLSYRKQFVQVNGVHSDTKPITVGVPQGSVLGPLLFLLFINDLPSAILSNSTVSMYADDTILIASSDNLSTLNSITNQDTNQILIWFNSNLLCLHPSKSSSILIAPPNLKNSHSFQPLINNIPIKVDNNLKHLGIYISDTLNWNFHINVLLKTISSRIGILRRAARLVPKDTRLIIYNAIVKPHFEYGISVWGSTSKKNLKKLQTLQNRAMRIITNLPFRTPTINLLSDLNWLNISNSINLNIASVIFNTLNHHNPSLLPLFRPAKNVHSFNTRNSKNNSVFIPFYRTSLRKSSLSMQGPLIWNAVPDCLKSCNSISSFRNQFTNFLLNLQ